MQADCGETYKKFEKQPHPRITDVKYAIDIYSETRGMEMHFARAIRRRAQKDFIAAALKTVEKMATKPEETIQ